MTSEIRANTLKNRVGLGTVSFTNTGPVVSGIVTIANSTTEGVTLEDNAGVGNSLKITTPTGYVSIGSGNATFVHLNTDRGVFYFQKRIFVDEGVIASYDEDLVLQSPSNTNRVIIDKDTGLVSILNDLDVDGQTNLDHVSIAGITTFTNSYIDFKPGNGGNAHFRILSTGTGDAGIFFDAANGDISGSDYVFIGQNNNLDFVINPNANAGNIDFQRAGTTQIRITSAGTLKFTGQNTSLETAGITHHTNNNLYIRGGTSGLVLGNHDNTNTIHISNSDFIKFETTDGSERVRIDSSGRLLIGKTSGDHILDIDASNSEIRLTKTNASDYTGIQLDRDASGTAGGYFGLAGATNHYVNGAAQHDICVRSQSNLLFSTNGADERFRIDSNGYIGIDYSTPYNGLTINKEGDYWDNNGNTYAHPEGRVLSTWGGDRNDDTDYWVGFVGKYLKPSATVNILLQPHVGNFNNQAGMYIAGEATGNFSSDFTLGAISSGNVAGRGTTASSGKRATKSELLRIKHDGRLLLGSDTNRTINGHLPKLQVTGTTYSNSTISIINNEANGNGAYIFLGKQRSGAVGGNTAVQANDIIGELRFPAGDGTDMENYAARIQVKAQINATGNNTPGYIDIYTTRQNGSSEHKMRMTQNSNHSHLFSMGTGTSHLNNCSTPDRTSVKIGGLLHIEGPTGHNATPGLYYNCYSGGNDLFYRGTGAPSGGDRRPAAYGQKFGGHYFYGDTSSTAWSAQQQITTMQLNMNISSQGYVTKPQTPAFFATHTGAGNNIIGTLTYNTSGNGYYNNGGHLNVSTGKFTAPVNGIYTFHFHGFFQTGQADAYYEVIFRRINSNGSGVTSVTRQYGYRHMDPSNQYGPSISMHYTGYMTTGQTMEVRTGNLAFHGSNGYFFGGHLVG